MRTRREAKFKMGGGTRPCPLDQSLAPTLVYDATAYFAFSQSLWFQHICVYVYDASLRTRSYVLLHDHDLCPRLKITVLLSE